MLEKFKRNIRKYSLLSVIRPAVMVALFLAGGCSRNLYYDSSMSKFSYSLIELFETDKSKLYRQNYFKLEDMKGDTLIFPFEVGVIKKFLAFRIKGDSLEVFYPIYIIDKSGSIKLANEKCLKITSTIDRDSDVEILPISDFCSVSVVENRILDWQLKQTFNYGLEPLKREHL
jgi:hypothetical protein